MGCQLLVNVIMKYLKGISKGRKWYQNMSKGNIYVGTYIKMEPNEGTKKLNSKMRCKLVPKRNYCFWNQVKPFKQWNKCTFCLQIG